MMNIYGLVWSYVCMVFVRLIFVYTILDMEITAHASKREKRGNFGFVKLKLLPIWFNGMDICVCMSVLFN